MTGAGLVLLCLLSWWYVLDGAGTGMSTRAMTTWQFPPPPYDSSGDAWPWRYALVMLGMWWVMMAAMMIPSAAPTILLYARVHRHHQPQGAGPPVFVFLLGYLLAWLLFSAAATFLHALLERPGAILSREQLENRIYGWGEEVTSNAIDVLIHGMRRKLGAESIRNVRGLGWRVAA